jgi:hypothetical protein
MRILPLFLLLTPAAASAQDMSALAACAAKVEDADRLACYDAAVAAIAPETRATLAARKEAAAKAQAERLAAERAAAERAKRDSFGGESVAAQRANLSAERLDSVEASITEVLRSPLGASVFLLDNGQIWRQSDIRQLPPIRPGAAVTLKRGALGSYQMTIPSIRRSMAVRRDR